MAIIGQVERKNWKVKLLNVCIHMILIVGAATMVYPLLLMISGSFKSYVDFKDFSVFPEYITVKIPGIVDTTKSSEEMLFKKHVYSKYNGTATAAEAYFKEPGVIIDNLTPPKTVSKKRIDDYSEFLALKRIGLPHYWRVIGMADEMGVYPLSLRNYREFMQKKFGDDRLGLEKMNNEYFVDYTSWDSIFLLKENFFNGRAATSYTTGMLPSILEFKDSKYLTPLTTVWPDFDANFVSTLRRECAISLAEINQKLGTDYNSWGEITISHTMPENPELMKIWSSFVKNEINLIFVHIDSEAASPAWREFLKEKYADIADVNAIHHANWASFDDVVMSSDAPEMGQLRADWNMFLNEYAKPEDLTVDTLGLQYRDWLQGKYPSLNALNQAYGNGYSTFEEIKLMDLPPRDSNLKMTTAWNEFVLTLPPKEIALARQSAMDYRKFIIEFYTDEEGKTDFEQMSADYKYTVKGENYVPTHIIFPESGPRATPKAQEHYLLAINDARFRSQYRLDKPEEFQTQWTEFLKAKYSGDITALNEDWRLYETDWSSIALPTKEYEWDLMLQNKSFVTKEFLKRNYLMVFDTLITNGDAALNTVIYCFLAVAAALLVNPLCAYGLSRYKPAASYKILLFLMLPMAFPGMVLGIPQFLLVKNLGLLNTFAALILPGMANGYSIFLLKGFFDSLPKELFESAAIDGASEWTVFWHIAMGLSTPILSVLALGAFTGAYGNFMLAFLLCQEKSMWTMMVYLYQLQQRASQAVGFAALLIAAIPTLIVFIFCQNIIIKGIVVPTEK